MPHAPRLDLPTHNVLTLARPDAGTAGDSERGHRAEGANTPKSNAHYLSLSRRLRAGDAGNSKADARPFDSKNAGPPRQRWRIAVLTGTFLTRAATGSADAAPARQRDGCTESYLYGRARRARPLPRRRTGPISGLGV